MEKILIFGTNQFAEVMYYHLQQDNKYEVYAFTVHRHYCTEDLFMGLPVIPFEDISTFYKEDEYSFLICVGYMKMNKVRQEIFQEVKKKGYQIISYIHPYAVVLSTNFGEGNIIMENVTIGLRCKIGDGNVLYPGVNLAHHATIGNYNFFAVSCSIAGNVNISNYCFLGNNCTIKNGVNILNSTLVGAAAYIDHDTEEDGVYVPHRTIKLNKKSYDIDLLK